MASRGDALCRSAGCSLLGRLGPTCRVLGLLKGKGHLAVICLLIVALPLSAAAESQDVSEVKASGTAAEGVATDRATLTAAAVGEPDYYSKLVTVPGTVHGPVKKEGPIPASRYDDKLFNHTEFREWLMRGTVLHEEVPLPAPMSYRCGVFVNHNYKLIFIRNRKAASTTVLDTFKVACKSQSPLLCMRPFDAAELEAQGISHDKMWMDYYVVSSTRNPWARAASGYDYTHDRWPIKEGVCATPPFRQFCTDPFLMGKMANLFRCGTQSSFRGDDAWAYDFYHVEPAYHCMTDESGKRLAVDFLIRYEFLHEDFMRLLDILNKRRDPSLPEIKYGKMRWMKQGLHVQQAKDATGGSWEDAAALISTDRHATKYRECGMECVDAVGKFFERDIEIMKMADMPERPS